MSGERRPGSSRSSLARAPSGRARADEEEGLGLDGRAPAAAAMDAPEEVEVAPTPKARAGPVTVGRSLEISVTPEVCMELLVDKLKLLDYESGFCKKKKPYRKPLTTLYFAWALPAGNHGEQFFYFTSLTSWLLGLAGVELAPPKEHEDPNLACNNIISSVKKLGFAAPSYPPMKLTSGYGKEVCGVLDGLVDFVLERSNFTYKKPLYLPDGYVEDTDGGGDGVDEDPDMGAGLDGADDFKLPEDKDDGVEDEEAYSELGLALPPGAKPKGGGAAGEQADKAVVMSKVDPTAWRLELERVGPKLRILLNADAKDWRTNLEEVHSHSKAISVAWPESKGVLEKLRSDLNNSLEKLTTRERFLNEQFERLMQQYRAQRQQLLDVQGLFNKHSEAYSDRNTELERIKEQLGDMKQQMEDRGSNISDATPVVKIKKAIEKVKEELHEMEVRIGVVSHTFLQHTLKSRRAQHQHAAAGSDDDDM